MSVTVTQLALLFVLGGPLFDLHVSGSIVAIGLIIVVLALSLSAFGMAATAISRTMQQLNAIGSWAPSGWRCSAGLGAGGINAGVGPGNRPRPCPPTGR